MFRHNFNGGFLEDKTGTQISVDGITFTGIQPHYYVEDTGDVAIDKLVFVMSDGGQFSQTSSTSVYGTWAVRSGGSPVPEPATYVMAAFGLLALGLYGWRRKRA